MHRSTKISTIRRALFGVGVALVIGSGLAMAAPPAQSPASAQSSGVVVEVSQTEDLVDGQPIEVRVTAPAGLRLNGGSIRICRDGPTYATLADLQVPAGNCPGTNITSSGSVANHASLFRMPGTDDRVMVGTYRVGVGTVEWTRGSDSWTLSCDTANPCRLALELRTSTGTVQVDTSTLLTFSDTSPLGACGGSSPNALDTGGSDRFIDTWARWTRAHCESTGSRAATTAVLMGEGLGLDSFAVGDSDLVYSATGPTIPGRRPSPATRGAVAVPIGVNAAVIALVGGWLDTGAEDWPIGLRRPFGRTRVTAEEMATLFGQSTHGLVATGLDAQLQTRNPELASVNGFYGPVGAPAASDAVSFFTTRWFDTRAGTRWLTSPIVEPPNSPRSVVDEFSAADPGFEPWIMEMYSSRATLKKLIADDANQPGGGNLHWLLTDLATAEQLGLPVAQLQNSRGEWVAPTTDSLMRAVASMERRPDGTIISGSGPDAAGAYPLTFVEHAVVAAEPDCDSPKQPVLVDWLDYITGEGQQHLVGVRPLAGDLVGASAEARAKVVAACDPDRTPPPVTPAGPTAPAPPAGPGTPPGGGFDGAFGDGGFGGGAFGDLFGDQLDGGGGFDGDDGGLGGTDDGPGSEGDGSGDDADDADEVADASELDENLDPVTGTPGNRGSAGVLALLGLAFMGAGAGSLSRNARRGVGAVA